MSICKHFTLDLTCQPYLSTITHLRKIQSLRREKILLQYLRILQCLMLYAKFRANYKNERSLNCCCTTHEQHGIQRKIKGIRFEKQCNSVIEACWVLNTFLNVLTADDFIQNNMSNCKHFTSDLTY